MTYHVLLVDDDVTQAAVVQSIIRNKMQHNTTFIDSGQKAVDYLMSEQGNAVDVVLLDLSMPDIDGVKVLQMVRSKRPNIPFIIRTGYNDIDMIVQAMKEGACDYIKKLDSTARLQESIEGALNRQAVPSRPYDLNKIRANVTQEVSFDEILGNTPVVKEMKSLAKRVASSSISVLLEGGSGVGKEMLARAIHSSSDRKDRPFVSVNCGAMPEHLVETILFGEAQGHIGNVSFTTKGKFKEAEGGTLFFDEIGALSKDIQVKITRILQDTELSESGNVPDVRLITATSMNLNNEIHEGRFREDLFYRLNVCSIYVPSLKERKQDIPLLIKHFIKQFAASEKLHVTDIESDTMQMLCKFEWPGNVRQLKNALYRAVTLCERKVLADDDFPQIIKEIDQSWQHQLNDAEHLEKYLHKQAVNMLQLEQPNGNFKTLQEVEREVIMQALKHYNCHMSKVAEHLGIGRSTLYRKLSEYDLQVDLGGQSNDN